MEWLRWVHGATGPAASIAFAPGDEVRVWHRILEQGKERLGQFEGTVIRVRGTGPSKTFTVRRITHGEGVERVFPVDSKTIARIEVLRQGKVRRARLYFLRTVVGKTRVESAGEPDATAAPLGASVAAGVPSTARTTAEKPEGEASASGSGKLAYAAPGSTTIPAGDEPPRT